MSEPTTAKEVCENLVHALNRLRYSRKGKKETKLKKCEIEKPIEVSGGGIRYGIKATLRIPSSVMDGPIRKHMPNKISNEFKIQAGMKRFSVPDEFAQLLDHDKTFDIAVNILTPVDWIPEDRSKPKQRPPVDIFSSKTYV